MIIYFETLSRVEDLVRGRRIKISVYELGYIGMATAASYIDKGFKVIGYDIDFERGKNLENGSIRHPDPRVRNILVRGDRDGLLERLADLCRDPSALIYMSNPNNSTGVYIDIEKLYDLFSGSSCYVIVDEAYAELCSKCPLKPEEPPIIS